MIRQVWARLAAEQMRPVHGLLGVMLAGLVTILGTVTAPIVTPTHLALMYLLAVLVVSVRFGLRPALVTAAVSVAALDFLFLPPVYSFAVNTPQDALLLVFLSTAAVIASGLAARLREQAMIAERNAATTAALGRFAGKLAGILTVEAVIAAVDEQAGAMLPHRVTIYCAGETPLPAPLVLPLRAGRETVGVMTVTPGTDRDITGEEHRLVEALAELTAIAIGRQILADQVAQLGIEQEADRLRSALLHSIAHDLTAPIGSVASALGALNDDYEALDDHNRRELIAEVEGEAKRLHRFSSNLVHITRLEAGVVRPCLERAQIADLIAGALSRARDILRPRPIIVDILADLPPADFDFVLMEQAVFHLFENAAKYTPTTATITIVASTVEAAIVIRIGDDGPGFPPDDSERIFAKFYRGNGVGSGPGTGLGLAICRGFIAAHGGTVTAANRSDGQGALFTIWLPLGSGAPAGTARSREA